MQIWSWLTAVSVITQSCTFRNWVHIRQTWTHQVGVQRAHTYIILAKQWTLMMSATSDDDPPQTLQNSSGFAQSSYLSGHGSVAANVSASRESAQVFGSWRCQRCSSAHKAGLFPLECSTLFCIRIIGWFYAATFKLVLQPLQLTLKMFTKE